MLTPQQRVQVEALILDFIGMGPSSGAVRTLIGLEAMQGVPPGANAARVASWLLDHILALPQPDGFIKVVAIVDEAGELVDVHELVQRLHQQASLWPTRLLDELWVPAEWPFVDREGLRQALAAMAAGDGPGAITIEAPAGYGKRTMAAYVQQLARRNGNFRAVLAELRRMPDPGFLDILVADLRVSLGLDIDWGDTAHEEPERRAVVLARNLARDAAFAPTTVWFVANVLEVAGLEEGLLRFVDQLLGLVQETQAGPRRLRVVLLSDELARLELENLPALDDRHVLSEVNATAVSEWLAAAVPGKAEPLYSMATAMVLENVEARRPPPSMRLHWLARNCVVAHRNLVRAV